MTSIDSLQHEERHFPPTPEFTANAIAKPELYEAAAADRLAFWADQSRELLHWHTPFTQTLDWSDAPFAKWFADGKLNVAYNCLDRHVEAGNGDRVAIHWEGEPGDTRTITYAELTADVKRAANALTALGVDAGRPRRDLPADDPGGRGRDARGRPPRCGPLRRLRRLQRRLAARPHRRRRGEARHHRRRRLAQGQGLPAQGHRRRGRRGRSRRQPSTIEHVLVVKRGENDVAWDDGRDVWWHDAMQDAAAEHEAEAFDAENPLFILYTSGTTGKPKGILHTTGGYLTQVAFTHKNVFDLHPETDVYWCSADVGWITGHSYVVYGPLANGATQVMYEGTPDTPHPGRWWELIQKYKVSIFYTAPTAIRSFMKIGRQVPDGFDLSSIRVLGSVGEPINPEAWIWYRDVIGGGSAPIVDTWWQTETGAIMVSPLPGITDDEARAARRCRSPASRSTSSTTTGRRSAPAAAACSSITEPWPSMLRGIWGDPERYKETYWEKFGDRYFAGDGARLDEDHDLWLMGRVDDVMNVSGHRLSTAEIESALVSHPIVAESAVVGANDETTGQAVVAFVILRSEQADGPVARRGERAAARPRQRRRSARSRGRVRSSS